MEHIKSFYEHVVAQLLAHNYKLFSILRLILKAILDVVLVNLWIYNGISRSLSHLISELKMNNFVVFVCSKQEELLEEDNGLDESIDDGDLVSFSIIYICLSV